MADAPVLICGTLSRRDEQPKIMVREVFPLTEAAKHFTEKVVVAVRADTPKTDEQIAGIKDLASTRPGTVPLFIYLMYDGKKRFVVKASSSYTIDPSGDFRETAEKVLGKDSIILVAKKSIYKDPRPERRWQRE